MSRRRRHAAGSDIAGLVAGSMTRIDSLDEITGWLGTFRERLRLARESERPQFEAMLNRLEAHYKERRAELA